MHGDIRAHKANPKAKPSSDRSYSSQPQLTDKNETEHEFGNNEFALPNKAFLLSAAVSESLSSPYPGCQTVLPDSVPGKQKDYTPKQVKYKLRGIWRISSATF